MNSPVDSAMKWLDDLLGYTPEVDPVGEANRANFDAFSNQVARLGFTVHAEAITKTHNDNGPLLFTKADENFCIMLHPYTENHMLRGIWCRTIYLKEKQPVTKSEFMLPIESYTEEALVDVMKKTMQAAAQHHLLTTIEPPSKSKH